MHVNLALYTKTQLERISPDGHEISLPLMEKITERSLKRLATCFAGIADKYYAGSFPQSFNHLNTDHYSMYLYLLSNECYELGSDNQLASKLFALNKMLHGIDVFYKVKLPTIFLFVHPVGTVIGAGKFADYFCIYQNCTVGAKDAGRYPEFLGPAILYSGSSVIGESRIGANVILGAGASLIDSSVEKNTLVLGRHPHQRLKPLGESEKYFHDNFSIVLTT